MKNRRQFISELGLTLLATGFPVLASSPNPIKPPRLRVGDTVGIIAPSGWITTQELKFVTWQLMQQGLNPKAAPHLMDKYGYLAGLDRDRAADVNTMFADPNIRGIITAAGGWGAARILPLLDYNIIRNNPKVIIGYSDITSLLLAIYSQCNFITFHGLLGTSHWRSFSVNYLKRVLFTGEAVTFENPGNIRVETITSGSARGQLVGGNLSVLAGLVGSEYLPNWSGKILFIEDINEDVYRVDRLLTQLKLAGILDQLSGFIFGQCSRCSPGREGESSFSLWEVLVDHIQPLGIPAWYGSAIGHIRDQFTIAIGGMVEINSDRGTIQMLEAAVS
ncbi:MAG: LD-carboxypeptidase [Limnospira sp. PMC 1291.21]|nr:MULTISPECIES: LD-carboxypeptidase [Limnospira]MDY7052605.1 LD-carboxypeptidase [Limnospira fusiformis LS22]UWU49135.1 muramoyltetrapeptide carboxypeptidase [Arthrospira platensis C1]MDT9176777.1 LD-carboxypeptidase [Limnospira sp. PMC 1238.20]MDT9186686.1 LD-carboxypeptidase [Limnospira sp. PMC 894.15]MDT9192095.1 LD-carboxypeptidase [Limnospira sp. PMC 1245.20]